MLNPRLISLTILALVLTGVIWWTQPYFRALEPSPTPTASTTISPDQTFTITQTIVYGQNQASNSAQIDVKKGETAFQALTTHHETTTKQYDFGTLVEGINGVENGAQDKYWMYYINGQEASVGATEYQVQPGDDIRWEFKAYDD